MAEPVSHEKVDKTSTETNTLFPVCCVLIGAVFLLFPDWILGTLSLILGVLCIAYGAWKLFGAFRGSGFTRGGAAIGGVRAVVLGIYIIRRPEQVFSLLPLAAGVLFLLDGIDRIRSAAAMHRTTKNAVGGMRNIAAMQKQKQRFWTACAIGVVTFLCGLFLIFHSFDAIRFTLRVVGVFILLNGIGALWTAHAVEMTVQIFSDKTKTRPADGKYDADFRDITNER